MLRTSILFFVVALVAMLFGFYGIAGVSAELGKILLGIFLVLAVLTYLFGMFSGRPRKL
jgi:uncharacterized membrane protein YtjA (UPF0391 family)